MSFGLGHRTYDKVWGPIVRQNLGSLRQKSDCFQSKNGHVWSKCCWSRTWHRTIAQLFWMPSRKRLHRWSKVWQKTKLERKELGDNSRPPIIPAIESSASLRSYELESHNISLKTVDQPNIKMLFCWLFCAPGMESFDLFWQHTDRC